MKRIGIFGGTFDPIHIGHLIAAEQVLYHTKLDEIWFMPASKPPHKLDMKITAVHHRVEMVRRVISLDPRYHICTIELDRKGPSYSLDTVKELKKKYPNYSFFFIIGGDMIEYLAKWHGIEELIEIVEFIGLKRPGFSFQPKNEQEQKIFGRIQLIPMLQLEISSSRIREWINKGRTVRYLVPSSVEEYIKENGLYEG